MKPLLHAWISFAQSNVCTTSRDNIWFIFQLHSLSLISQFIHSFSIEFSTDDLFMYQHYKCNQFQRSVRLRRICSINNCSRRKIASMMTHSLCCANGVRRYKWVLIEFDSSRVRFRICMRENVHFSITVNFMEQSRQSISHSHYHDLTIACFYFIFLMSFREQLQLQFSLTRPLLYNTIPPPVAPSEDRHPPQSCRSCFNSLCFCCSQCFTNSWYALPFPFLLFCWQKLHWWKLTCKVDSSDCLIQSLIPPPPPPPSPSSCIWNASASPTSPHSLTSHSQTLPEQEDCPVWTHPPNKWNGLQSHMNTSHCRLVSKPMGLTFLICITHSVSFLMDKCFVLYCGFIFYFPSTYILPSRETFAWPETLLLTTFSPAWISS